MSHRYPLQPALPTLKTRWECDMSPESHDRTMAEIRAAGMEPVAWGWHPRSQKKARAAYRWFECQPIKPLARVSLKDL